MFSGNSQSSILPGSAAMVRDVHDNPDSGHKTSNLSFRFLVSLSKLVDENIDTSMFSPLVF